MPSSARAVKKKTEQIQKCKLLISFPSRFGHSILIPVGIILPRSIPEYFSHSL
jgi:hypothetical protein